MEALEQREVIVLLTQLERQVTPATLGQRAPMVPQAILATPEALATPVRLAPMATPVRREQQAQVQQPGEQQVPVVPPTRRTRTLQSSCGRHIPCRSPHRGKS